VCITSADTVNYGNNILDTPSKKGIGYNPTRVLGENTIRQLARICFPSSDKDKYMLMLEAYFDETGHDDDPNSRFCGILGCLAKAEDWERLERKWQKALSEAGIDFFHSTEFAHSTGQFKDGWKGDKKKRDDFYKYLLQIIGEVKPIFLGCLIPMPAYRSLNGDVQNMLVSAYHQSFHEVFRQVLNFGIIKAIDTVTMVFDDKPKVKRDVNNLYEAVMALDKEHSNKLSRRVPSPIFRNMRDVSSLQVADIIAYESFKEYSRRLYSPQYNPRPGWKWMESAARWRKTDMERRYHAEPLIYHGDGMPLVFCTNEWVESFRHGQLLDLNGKVVKEF
jgi:Protein of unknown function (DUF3800)